MSLLGENSNRCSDGNPGGSPITQTVLKNTARDTERRAALKFWMPEAEFNGQTEWNHTIIVVMIQSLAVSSNVI